MHPKVLPLAAGAASILAIAVQAQAQTAREEQEVETGRAYQDNPNYYPQPQPSQPLPQRSAPTRLYQQGPDLSASGPTLICKLTSGPGAGTSFDFRGTADTPARAGADCSDMAGSRGVAVAPPVAGQPGQRGTYGRHYQTWRDQAGFTFTCRFTHGPRAGSSEDFANKPGSSSVRIGGGCSDGAGSTGVGVAPSSGQRLQQQEGPY